MRYFLFPSTTIMRTTTLIVTSSARFILITHVEIYTNLNTNIRSHKQADAIETLKLNQNQMHALIDDKNFLKVQFLNATNAILQVMRITNSDAITR